MKWLFKPPSSEEVIGLLVAWRIWLLGALAGGIVAGLIYLTVPPPYRAQATLLVDHNVELVIPQEDDDTRRFYYLQEENDKLIQIAWSDDVLLEVSSVTSIPVEELRSDYLKLNHPGDGGWHLLADSRDPQEAKDVAYAWAQEFYEALTSGGPGVNPIIEITLVQVDYLVPIRAVAPGVYLFFGSMVGSAVVAFFLLFFHKKAG